MRTIARDEASKAIDRFRQDAARTPLGHRNREQIVQDHPFGPRPAGYPYGTGEFHAQPAAPVSHLGEDIRLFDGPARTLVASTLDQHSDDGQFISAFAFSGGGSAFSARGSAPQIYQASAAPGTTGFPFGGSTRLTGNPSAISRLQEARPVFNGTAQPEMLVPPVLASRSFDQDLAAATSLRRFALESGGVPRGTRRHWVGPAEDHLPERSPATDCSQARSISGRIANT